MIDEILASGMFGGVVAIITFALSFALLKIFKIK